MHLLEQYALSCGIKIDKPFIECNYFPLPFTKYIVVHPSSGMEAKNYDYYNDVLGLMLPHLKERGIKIIQIGGRQDERLKDVYYLQGVTNLNQTFYLIKNALLVLGNDSFSAHVAGHFDKKLVTLYSNIYLNCCKPYWGKKDNQRLIQAPLDGARPSFSNKEEKKVVNGIFPEEIASSALDLLEIPHSLNEIETLSLGSKYPPTTVEVVPNHRVHIDLPHDHPINIRLDYGFDPKYFMEWSKGKKVHVVLDKPVNPKYLFPLRGDILKITAFVDDSFPTSYPQTIKKIGVDIELFTKNWRAISDLRVKFIDWVVQHYEPLQKKDLDFADKICDNTYFKSNKIIYSNGKEFNCKAAMDLGIERAQELKIINNPDFWEEAEYFNIYNKNA